MQIIFGHFFFVTFVSLHFGEFIANFRLNYLKIGDCFLFGLKISTDNNIKVSESHCINHAFELNQIHYDFVTLTDFTRWFTLSCTCFISNLKNKIRFQFNFVKKKNCIKFDKIFGEWIVWNAMKFLSPISNEQFRTQFLILVLWQSLQSSVTLCSMADENCFVSKLQVKHFVINRIWNLDYFFVVAQSI